MDGKFLGPAGVPVMPARVTPVQKLNSSRAVQAVLKSKNLRHPGDVHSLAQPRRSPFAFLRPNGNR